MSHHVPRGQHHACGSCGCTIKKAHRVFHDQPFCDTCYAREFLRRPCSRCAEPTLLHISQETGLCRKCEQLERVCLRCARPVKRAALLVGGEPVCPSCRRHFPPFPAKTKPKNHATCGICRKYRRVVRRDEADRPYCSRCADTDRREEVAEQEARYWLDSLAQRTVQLAPLLTTPWCQELFKTFVEAEVGRTPAQALALNLKHHHQVFMALETRMPDIAVATSAQFLEKFTAAEMRRWEMVFGFLRRQGYALPKADDLERASDLRRIQAAIKGVERCHDGWRIARFAKHLDAQSSTIKTQRVAIRAACGLVQVHPSSRLTQKSVDAYLAAKPGQRAALSSFIGYLRGQGVALRLPKKPPKRKKGVSRLKDLDACIGILQHSQNYGQLRAAVAGVLIGLLGMQLKAALKLPREALTWSAGGISLALPGQTVELDSRLVEGISRYLALRDADVGHVGGLLFPGRAGVERVSEATLGYHFKEWGVSARNLIVAGREYLARSGVTPLAVETA